MSATKEDQTYLHNVIDTIGKSFVASMLSMMYELDVLKLLSDTEKPMTSHEIAKEKKLKERYVREAMNCLACANFVGIKRDEAGQVRYHMTRAQGEIVNNYVMIGLVSSQAARFVPMVQRFKKDGPYDLPFTDDSMAMAGIDRVLVGRVAEEVELILNTTPGLRGRMEKGIKAIECGSGSGVFLTSFAEKFPNTKFIGSDVTDASKVMLTEKMRKLNLKNVAIEKVDLLNVPNHMHGQFDFAFVSDVIHDIPDSEKGLRNIRKMLKPGCYLAMIEVHCHSDVIKNQADNPSAACQYGMSAFHCVAQSYHNEDSVALGLCWGKEAAIQMLEKVGFKVEGVHVHCESFVLFVCKAI